MGECAPLITLRGVVLGPLTAAGMLYYVVVVGQGLGAGAQRPHCQFIDADHLTFRLKTS